MEIKNLSSTSKNGIDVSMHNCVEGGEVGAGARKGRDTEAELEGYCYSWKKLTSGRIVTCL